MATQLTTTDDKRDMALAKSIGTTQLDSNAPRSMFQPANMGEAMEIARLMAGSNFVAPHLRGKPGDCLAVVMQAARWAMDPFAVANKTFFVNDRIAYEAQLVTAVINSSGVLDGRLHPEWEGEGNELVCTVTGKLKGDDEPKKRRVAIKNITTRNSPLWKQDPEQQIGYYASRAWVRLHAPEVLLGVYSPDEFEAPMSAAGAGSLAETREAKPLTAAMLTQQATDKQVAEHVEAIDGRADEDHGEATTLESAKAEIDATKMVPDVNSRLSALIPLLSDDDGDALRSHAMDRIAELKEATNG
ncbi:recombinase RecT [Stakelama pacifica]|uniref:RecT family protein n=1 Tax=Stakelama pacifica TaxID=517720 RepID=A0A4R6FM79_9SPHN|nr:recombinase RecT [Stakelama pacifica]TDN81735.1 RecT family protein [Stakelama pacifica]GGO96403.1 enterohemolysin [Stakelama pacifica]